MDATYVAFDVHPDRVDQVANAIRTLDIRGCNLTVPFKGAILPDLDRITRAAEEARAVNTVIQHRGYLTGYNTDGEGFARALEAEHGTLPAGAHGVVLGAGGAGRAVAAALAVRGARTITLLNRTPTHGVSAARHLSRYFPSTAFEAAPLTAGPFLEAARTADVIVNCTAGTGEAAVRALPAHEIRPETIWVDINYWMADPPHLHALQRAGRRTQDGLPMLLHQGALAFELFTGLPVEAGLFLPHLPRWDRAGAAPTPRR